MGTEDEFFGWTFWDSTAYLAQQGDQGGRANWDESIGPNGTHAVADPDAHDDFTGFGETPLFSSALRTPTFPVNGAPNVSLRFDSSWRPEDNQVAEFNVYLDGQKETIFRWESDDTSPNFKGDATFETISIDVETEGVSDMYLEWDMPQAGNDWWWAIDNILAVGIPDIATLQVRPSDGLARIVSGLSEASYELRSYQILDPNGGLTNEDWETGNLSAQGVDAIDPNTPGDRWDEVQSTPEAIMEAFLNGGTTLAPGESVIIGKILPPTPQGQSLPDFEFSVATDDFLVGADNSVQLTDLKVELFEFPNLVPEDGDFDNDGDVDGSDFLKWQRDGGTAVELSNWINTYGQTGLLSGLSASQAVPEPTALCLLIGSVVITVAGRRGHR